mmetsp:Transcript_43485/g.98284  ORF Transcript_43485/g.98284 Transcript_43485/m.98284 type:complete len:123 (+) Transcript_43485:65-433(+)
MPRLFATLALLTSAILTQAFTPTTTFLGSSMSTAGIANQQSMTMRARHCDLTGKTPNRQAMAVSFSHKRTKKVQGVNLQSKRIWWPEGNKFVNMRISTKVRQEAGPTLTLGFCLNKGYYALA